MDPKKNLAGKVAGELKSAGKALRGYRGIFLQLAEEHGEVSNLLERAASSDEDSQERPELFEKIRKELLSHAQAEERTFYAPLRSRDDTKQLVKHGWEEHKEAEKLLDQLSETAFDTVDWTITMQELADLIADHVEDEERDLFPKASEHVTKEEAEEMREEYMKAKEAALTQLG